jgi:hypothetical protein
MLMRAHPITLLDVGYKRRAPLKPKACISPI